MIDNIDETAGRVLRYVTSRGLSEPVTPRMCVVKIPWSYLPGSVWEAKQALNRLCRLGLIEHSADGYTPLPAGHQAIAEGNKAGRWRSTKP